MKININRAFSDWYDSQPTQPTYQETFEAGQQWCAQDSEMMQAITDQENQPSQFGTVTLAMHEEQRKILAQALAAMLGVEKLFRANGFAMGGTSTAPFMAAITAIQGVLK